MAEVTISIEYLMSLMKDNSDAREEIKRLKKEVPGPGPDKNAFGLNNPSKLGEQFRDGQSAKVREMESAWHEREQVISKLLKHNEKLEKEIVRLKAKTVRYDK